MAYKIRYGGDRPKKTRRQSARLFVLTVCFFLLFLLTASYFAPAQLERLRQTFFPQSCVDALLQELRNGEPLTEAVSAFCQEIFHDN